MGTINRNYKDSLFKIVFGDHKENALALYNAINETDYTDAEDLTVTTLDDVVYMSIKNDVAFIFDDTMNLYEHQSTYNPNMPLRGLEYFSTLYNNYIDKAKEGHSVLYKSSLIHIPTPHYYVFYNGLKKQPAETILHLSEAYSGYGDIEITAHVINVNKGENPQLAARCRPLSDFSEFVYRVRNNKRTGMDDDEAVKAAVDSCIKDGVLKSILQEDRNRVISSILTALTQEEIDALHESELNDAREKAISEGLEQGREEGREQGREEGLEEGRKQGLEEGREQALKQKDTLFKLMLKDERLDDYTKSVDDPDFYNKLLKEYGLTK